MSKGKHKNKNKNKGKDYRKESKNKLRIMLKNETWGDQTRFLNHRQREE